MGRRRQRRRRSTSANIRHRIGLVLLGVILLFILQLIVTSLAQGNWRGAAFALAAGVGLVLLTLYSGRQG